MAKVLLVQPWNYHDEGVRDHDPAREWRNGPYSLLLLGTILKKNGHSVAIIDMIRDLVVFHGDTGMCLDTLSRSIQSFRPDIIGFGFFSIHYLEVQAAVAAARRACRAIGLEPLFIAGGIHASSEPKRTISELGFDFAFVGEADKGLLDIAEGIFPGKIPGVCGPDTIRYDKGETVTELDSLPFPDWSLCDYGFYSYPSYGKIKFKAVRTLDLIMGRGCVYKCTFCAYNALSSVRFYSAEYLVNQVEQMYRDYGIDSVYFTDSTIGNNRKLVVEFCELMMKRKLNKRLEWYANMRPNQIDEKFLKLLWKSGCRFLFYGFESGSQRVLNSMAKGLDVRHNYRAAELHTTLRFPYHASILLGYPGETEEDLLETFRFVETVRPPIMGVNWYVPLPGSPDYDALKEKGIITIDDPMEWRRIGEVNDARVYADMPEKRFRELFAKMEHIAFSEAPKTRQAVWGCLSPPQSEMNPGEYTGDTGNRSAIGTLILKLMRSVRI